VLANWRHSSPIIIILKQFRFLSTVCDENLFVSIYTYRCPFVDDVIKEVEVSVEIVELTGDSTEWDKDEQEDGYIYCSHCQHCSLFCSVGPWYYINSPVIYTFSSA